MNRHAPVSIGFPCWTLPWIPEIIDTEDAFLQIEDQQWFATIGSKMIHLIFPYPFNRHPNIRG